MESIEANCFSVILKQPWAFFSFVMLTAESNKPQNTSVFTVVSDVGLSMEADHKIKNTSGNTGEV